MAPNPTLSLFISNSASKLLMTSKPNKRLVVVEPFHRICWRMLVKCIWKGESCKNISHKHSCLFGAICIDRKQVFRQYDVFNGDTFLEFLKKIHDKFPKYYLFMDKASPHYKSKKVQKDLEK